MWLGACQSYLRLSSLHSPCGIFLIALWCKRIQPRKSLLEKQTNKTKNWCFSSASWYPLKTAPWLGVGPPIPTFLSQSWDPGWLNLFRPCACCLLSVSEFMCVSVLLCLEETVSLQCSIISSSYDLAVSSST